MAVRIGVALATGLLVATAGAQVLPSEKRFVREAYAVHRAEIRLGALALRQGSSSAIKEFARTMVRDHGKAQAGLSDVLRAKRIDAPIRATAEAETLYKRLQNLRGVAFDRAYRQAMMAGRHNEVTAYEQISRRGSDPEIRLYATDTLPVLRMHLQMIRATKR